MNIDPKIDEGILEAMEGGAEHTDEVAGNQEQPEGGRYGTGSRAKPVMFPRSRCPSQNQGSYIEGITRLFPLSTQ